MSSSRILFAGETLSTPVVWRIVSESGKVVSSGSGDLAAFSESKGSNTILVLPGALVSCVTVPLAARSEKQARNIAKFAVEDEIATNLDELHVALLASKSEGETGRRTVFAVESRIIEEWLYALAELGVKPDRVVPDYMCLPCAPGELAVAGSLDRVLLSTGDWGCSIGADLGADVVRSVLEAKNENRSLNSFGAEPSHWAERLFGDNAEGEPLDAMAAGAANAPINLLQGKYATRSEGIGLDLNTWLAPVGIAAAALLTLSVVNFIQAGSLAAEERGLRAETVDTFKQAFPAVDRVVNPRAQLRAMSSQGRTGDPEFLLLSSFLAAGLQSVETVTIDSVRFDTSRGSLDASIIFSNYDDLTAFKTAIEEAGGIVVEGGSRQVGSRRSGELKVSLS